MNLVTPDQVSLPPYYPDDAVFRKDWAEYLNSVQYTDREVGIYYPAPQGRRRCSIIPLSSS